MKKIPTLFHREFDNHKIIGITPEITEGCEEAFLHGTPTIKFDGSCCAVINGVFYKRYDAKKGKPIPKSAIKCQGEPDPITGHFPCWVKVNENNPSDKWFVKAYKKTLKSFAPDCTYEAIDPHFQGNPYNLEFDFLIKHGSEITDFPRTFEGVRHWLETHNEEGLVFWLDNKPVCKIKRSDFGFAWPSRIIMDGGKENDTDC